MGNLPSDISSFVGRSHEVAEIKRLLSRSRLLTLVGVGGVGKTRLAKESAAGMRRVFVDGVWLADLTRVSEPGLLSETVAGALRIRDQSSRDMPTVITNHLEGRRLLLIMDNCEHVLAECAELAEELLARVSGLRILATSRQAMNIPGEHIMTVAPLSLPEAAPDSNLLVGNQGEALTLFAERAVEVEHDFRITDENRDAVVGICRTLDGIPLAIELAAARLPALSPAQILQRLDDRYRLLTTGRQTTLPRHQTLRALIDWSFDLCTPAERLFWARSSVFAGSFDLEAARAVCVGEGIAAEDLLDLVDALVGKSILVCEEREPISRYRQLDTIREYGRHRAAESGEQAAIRRGHRDYYQGLAARTAREVFGANQVEWFARLPLVHPDLRAALEYCAAEPGQARAGLRLSADLLYHWVTSYYLHEGRAWLDRMLVLDPAPTLARADALWSNGWLAVIQNDVGAAMSMLSEARSLGERLEAPTVLGYVALYTGMAEMLAGDTASALVLYEEARIRNRAIGNMHGLAGALIRSSMAYSYLGDSARAIELGEECLAVCSAAGDIWHKSYALTALGIEVWRQGDSRRAGALEKESLHLNRALDDRLGIALNISVLALAAASEERYERAALLHGVLRTHWQSIGVSLSAYTHLAAYHEEYVQRSRRELGAQSYEQFAGEGSELSFERSLVVALDEKQEPSPTPSNELGVLTRREREIADLVMRGYSNRAIAATLVISRRTAEAHVQHILVKLGFTARSQIAAWIAGQTHRDQDNAG